MHFGSENERRLNSDENCVEFPTRFLYPYHKKSTELVLKEGQFYIMAYLKIYKRVYANLCIYFKILYYTVQIHVFINNLIFKYSAAKINT